jgi:hypothetical protein
MMLMNVPGWWVSVCVSASMGFAPPQLGEVARSCEREAERICVAAELACFHHEVSKCELVRARELEGARNWPVARAGYEIAARSALKAALAAREEARRAAAMTGYLDASVKVVELLVIEEHLHDAQQAQRRAREAVDDALARPEFAALAARPSIREGRERLLRSLAEARGEKAARDAEQMRREGAGDATVAGLVEQAAEHFREARRLATTQAHAERLLEREVAAWAQVAALRPESCGPRWAKLEALEGFRSRFAVEDSQGSARLRGGLEFEARRCEGYAHMERAKACGDHQCAADLYEKAAEEWERLLRGLLGGESALGAAFPVVEERYDRTENLLKETIFALESASRALRDDVGRATSEGRMLENQGRALISWCVEATAAEPVLREQLRRVEVTAVPGRMLYPDGRSVIAGAGLAGAGVAGLIAGPLMLMTGSLKTCGEDFCPVTSEGEAQAMQRRFDGSVAVMTIGGAALVAGAVLIGVGARRLHVAAGRTRRASAAPVLQWSALGGVVRF